MKRLLLKLTHHPDDAGALAGIIFCLLVTALLILVLVASTRGAV